MPALIVTKPDGSSYPEDLLQSEMRIGSGRHNQVILPGEGVPGYAWVVFDAKVRETAAGTFRILTAGLRAYL